MSKSNFFSSFLSTFFSPFLSKFTFLSTFLSKFTFLSAFLSKSTFLGAFLSTFLSTFSFEHFFERFFEYFFEHFSSIKPYLDSRVRRSTTAKSTKSMLGMIALSPTIRISSMLRSATSRSNYKCYGILLQFSYTSNKL